jgi:hypothetical protein
MKKLITAAALLIVSAATASPAIAGTLTAELRFADPRGGTHSDSTEYKLDYADTLTKYDLVGAEFTSKQAAGQGSVSSKLVGRVGPNIPSVLGVKVTPYAELGYTIKQGNDATLYGLGVKASRDVYGPVSLSVGYRHREGFKFADGIREDRFNGGLNYAVTKATSVGVQYYHTYGTTNADQIGVALAHKF